MANARQQWLEARDGGPGDWTIGGSEVAAIFGWDTWTDPIELHGRKLGLIPRTPSSPAARAGHFFEEPILRWYAEDTGRRVVLPREAAIAAVKAGDPTEVYPRELLEEAWAILDKPDEDLLDLVGILLRDLEVHHFGSDVTWRSRKDRWCVLTPDAFVLEPKLGGWGVVDAKNLNDRKRSDWRDGVPPDKSPQIAHYVRPTAFAWGGFACCFGGQELKPFDVPRHEMADLFELIEEEVPRFIRDHLETTIPPKATPSSACAAALAKLYPHPDTARAKAWVGPLHMADGSVFYPDEFSDNWETACAELGRAVENKRGLEAVVRQVAQGAGEIHLPDGSVFAVAKHGNGTRVVQRCGPR